MWVRGVVLPCASMVTTDSPIAAAMPLRKGTADVTWWSTVVVYSARPVVVSTISYFDPGCGTGDDAVLTRGGGMASAAATCS